MKEAQIHQAFSKCLDARQIPYIHSRTDKRTSTAVGDPDYLVCFGSRCVFIEIKVPGNRLSPAQEQRIAYIRAAGCRCVVAYSLEECVAAVESILCDHGQPEEELKQDGGDAICAKNSKQSVSITIDNKSKNETSASTGAAKSNPEAAPNFRIAKILGQDWVIAPDADGVWDRIRRASALDVAQFERVT